MGAVNGVTIVVPKLSLIKFTPAFDERGCSFFSQVSSLLLLKF